MEGDPVMLIYRPFNGTFFLCFAVFMAFLFISARILRQKPMETRRRFLAEIMVFTFIMFFVYKYCLSIDEEYSKICAENGIGEFSWWKELPLQLCNINLLLIPVAMATMNRSILNFNFFTGTLGALMAILMPSIGFSDCSILLPRMLGYYFTHFMVFTGSLAIMAYGIHTPKFRELPETAVLLLCVAFIVFLLSGLCRRTGLNGYVNYFYTWGPEGNAILELFYSVIPVPYLYEVPLILILAAYMWFVTFIINKAGGKQ